MRQIIHLDMDAFYAAIEQRDHPRYRQKPVIVGGNPAGRGVVSTASYEARKFGIHSAMPLREAMRLCPQGIFLPVRMHHYCEVSQRIMQIMSQYTPLVEPLSLDEAFLDVTGCQRLFGSAEQIARGIVKEIKEKEQLSASVGIAPNKFLAKIASDLQKPGGFVQITFANMAEILDDLPVSKIWGVGPKTTELLKKYGFNKIGDLKKVSKEYLRKLLGENGEHISELIQGKDERVIEPAEQTKSISHETTFMKDTEDLEYLAGIFLELAGKVARRLRKLRLKGRTVTVKIRDDNFKTILRHHTLEEATDFEEIIFHTALMLAEKVKWGGRKVRLLGVGLTNLVPDVSIQGVLFVDEQKEKLEKLHTTLDQIKDKYGDDIVRPGRILKNN